MDLSLFLNNNLSALLILNSNQFTTSTVDAEPPFCSKKSFNSFSRSSLLERGCDFCELSLILLNNSEEEGGVDVLLSENPATELPK